MAQKTVLIVYAHQSGGSFNSAAKDVAVEALRQQGYKVVVSDLYAMNFRASATMEDITGEVKNPEHFKYGEETMHAWKEGRLSDDIIAEQRKVEAAELVIFQDKKAMLSFSTGSMQTMYRPDGINGDINVTLWPLQNGVLHFCGFQVLAPQVFWCPGHSPPANRTAMLDGWRARLKTLLVERPLTFALSEMFDLTFPGGFMLRPEVRKEQSTRPHGITTGHHLGKPLPPDNQLKADDPSSLTTS